MKYRLFTLFFLIFFSATEVVLGQVDTIILNQPNQIPLVDSLTLKPDTILNKRRRVVAKTTSTDTTLMIPIQSDSVVLQKIKEHSPRKAALLSLIPGGGQIYNHRWWKLPIIYATMGTSGFLSFYFAKKMVAYRDEYFFRQYGAEQFYNPEFYMDGIDNVLTFKNNNQRYMEISAGVFVILYILNIIDAVVDAHLYYFDVSDDLSLRIAPTLMTNPATYSFSPGISFSFKLKK